LFEETPFLNEKPISLVKRLSIGKAKSINIFEKNKKYLIIGSDQVAVFKNKIIGKPLNKKNSIKQLQEFRGNKVIFYTGLAILSNSNNTFQTAYTKTTIYYRNFSKTEMLYALGVEKAYDCVGASKIEGFGISLVEKVISTDPTAIIGLPLIKLCKVLRNFGVKV
jgi:MAF protein